MAHESHYIHPDLKISGFTEHFHKSDVLFEEHLLVWFISGETKIIQGGQTYRFGAGDTLFFPRHELVTVINYPKDGLPHQSVVMHLTSQRLEAYYAKNKVDVKPVPKPRFRTFDKHPLLQSCLASLVPYFDLCEPLPEALAAIKIEEAVTILRMLAPDIDNLLADFGEPGKNGSTSHSLPHQGKETAAVGSLPRSRVRKPVAFRVCIQEAFRLCADGVMGIGRSGEIEASCAMIPVSLKWCKSRDLHQRLLKKSAVSA